MVLFFDDQERQDANDLNWRYGFVVDDEPYHSECVIQRPPSGPKGYPEIEKDKPGYRFRGWWCRRLVEPDRSWMFECPCGHVLEFHRWKRHRITKKLGASVLVCVDGDGCDCVLGMGGYRWIINWLGIDPKLC